MLPHPPGSVVRVFSRGGDHRDGDYAVNAAEVRSFATSYRDRNVYIAPNPCNSTVGSRHTAEEVTHWSYFLIDVDPICECPPEKKPKCRTCRGNADPDRALDEALKLLGMWHRVNFAKERPLLIDSGRGVQAWVRLEDMVLDNTMRRVARRVNGYWLRMLDENLGTAYGCRIDTSVSDLPRVMRCPGTINIKTGREAHVIDPSTNKYPGLAYSLIEGTPKQAMVDPDPPSGLRSGMTWQEVFAHLTRTAQGYLSLGQEEPGRHKVMWHTARKLQELGVDRAEASRALKWANNLRGEDSALPADQVEHALNTAYGA